MAYRVAGRGRREELLTSNTRRKFSLAASFSILGAGNLCRLGQKRTHHTFLLSNLGCFCMYQDSSSVMIFCEERPYMVHF